MGRAKELLVQSSKHIDHAYWAIYIFLIAIATVALTSASASLVYKTGSVLAPILKQITIYIGSALMVYVVQFVPSKVLRKMGYAVLGVAVVCLYLIMIPGSPFLDARNEAARWFHLGPIRFQPSEMAKLGLVVVIADLLSEVKTEEDKVRYFWITLGIAALTILPILTGNLSTAILMAFVVLAMWWIARLPWRYWLSVIGIFLVVAVGSYFIVETFYIQAGRPLPSLVKRATTWVSRVDDFVADLKAPKDEKIRITDKNQQKIYARIAVSKGGKSPLGVGVGQSKERDILPLAYADYIFSIIVEEGGIVAAIILILLYLSILARSCLISSLYEDYAAMYMVMGLALMLTTQTLISMGVAVGLGPVTGQPLPLFSMGGTSAVFTSLYFAFMMAVSREQRAMKAGESDIINQSWNELPEIDPDNPFDEHGPEANQNQ